MANPRTGFNIPNAADTASKLRIAEPDSVDFRSLGDSRFGVLGGCYGTVSGGTVLTLSASPDTQHVVVVNGKTVVIGGSSQVVTLQGGSSGQDRFDLVVYDDTAGRFRLLVGTPSASPVFPVPTDDQVVLYALFAESGATGFSPGVMTDKRIMLQRRFVTAIDDGDTLLANLRSDGLSKYSVSGDGRTSWGDVNISRTAARTLTVDGRLVVTGNETITGTLNVGADTTIAGQVQASNFLTGTGEPGVSTPGGISTVYQQKDGGGRLWIKQATDSGYAWAKIGTDLAVAGGVTAGDPPGTVITSLLPAGHIFLNGYLPMIGNSYSPSELGRLWYLGVGGMGIVATSPFISWLEYAAGPGNPATGMILPDATGASLLQSGETLGLMSGSSQRTLNLDNLPAHKHFNGVGQTDPNGSHAHAVSSANSGAHTHSLSSGGEHRHGVDDPGHAHPTDHLSGPYIRVQWNGAFRLDGPFTDASHPIAVDQNPFVSTGGTNIGVNTQYSGHGHSMNSASDHNHPVRMDNAPSHSHSMPSESSVGGGLPIDVTPRHLPVRYYVKT